MLRDMGETSIYNRVNEIAQQLDLIIESVPWMSTEDLQKDRSSGIWPCSLSARPAIPIFSTQTRGPSAFTATNGSKAKISPASSGVFPISGSPRRELAGSERRARVLSAQSGGRQHHEALRLHGAAPQPHCRPRPVHARGHGERGGPVGPGERDRSHTSGRPRVT